MSSWYDLWRVYGFFRVEFCVQHGHWDFEVHHIRETQLIDGRERNWFVARVWMWTGCVFALHPCDSTVLDFSSLRCQPRKILGITIRLWVCTVSGFENSVPDTCEQFLELVVGLATSCLRPLGRLRSSAVNLEFLLSHTGLRSDPSSTCGQRHERSELNERLRSTHSTMSCATLPSY